MTTEQFHWTSTSGVEIVLPRLGKIKASLLRKHRTKVGDDYVFSMLEDLADDETLAKIDDLDADELNELAEKWTDTMGGSSRSST
jgi:hypothetical protein